VTLSLREASAVNILIHHLTGTAGRVKEPPSRENALSALSTLADGAYRKMSAGFSADGAYAILRALWPEPGHDPTLTELVAGTVWWLDGLENPEPDLYLTEPAARDAALDEWKANNPFAEITNLEWLIRDDDVELNINHHYTGLIVRGLRLKSVPARKAAG
jgi:hypothetical protein